MNQPPLRPTRGQTLLAKLRQAANPAPQTSAAQAPRLSAAQQILLASQQLHDQLPVATVTNSWALYGALDAAALERAWQEVVARHDALRMSLSRSKGQTRPVFAPETGAALPCQTADAGSAQNKIAEIDRDIAQLAMTPLGSGGRGLWQAHLFQVDAGHHVFALAMHHAICDAWSWRIVIRDLVALYHRQLGVGGGALPDVGGFQAFLARPSAAPDATPARSRSAEVDWPTPPRPLPAKRGLQSRKTDWQLPAQDFARLRDVARVHGCTPFSFCMASLQFLLSNYCDQQELGLSLSAADRTAPGAQNSIGAFVRDIEVGARMHDHQRFSDLLQASTARFRQAQSAPGDDIHLARVAMGYYNLPNLPAEGPLLRADLRPQPPHLQSVNLRLNLFPGDTGLRVEFEGQARVFTDRQLRELSQCYRLILKQVTATPEITLSEIRLLPKGRIRKLAARSVHQAPLPTDGDIIDMFALIAAQHPQATAILTPYNSVDYATLDRDSTALARWLRAQGLAEGDRLAVLMPRCWQVFYSWLGALKAGLTVVPLDSELPASRVRYILDQAGAKAVLTLPGAPALPDSDVASLTLPAPEVLGTRPSLSLPLENRAPARDAFVMFTSGTTGAPKSIPINHVGIIRVVAGNEHLPVGPGDRLMQIASSGFDGSFVEVWGAWFTGATLTLCDKHIFAEGGLAAEFRKLQPTAAFITTSLFNTLVDAGPEALQSFRHIAIGGEAASAAHCRKALAANPSLRLSNIYGPTENAAFTTSHLIPADTIANVPIGRPLANNATFVLSDRLQPVPPGFAGELLVGGPGLSRGYENRPDLTREKFLTLAPGRLGLDGAQPLRLYRTGDRALWRGDQQLAFRGRRDTQFKLHGHRIEPSEVEAALMEHPNIGRAAIVPELRPGEANAHGMIAWFEPSGDRVPTANDLRAFLSTRLPKPHLPTRYLPIDAIPLNGNGKADVSALRDAFETAAARGGQRSDDPLVALWQEVLDLRSIPEDGDFYTLGGTSLSLVRMIAGAETTFGVDIDFATFTKAPTLGRLRQIISLSPALAQDGRRHLRLLRKGDASLPPLILTPTRNGSAAWALDLLPEMQARNPIWALTFQPPQGPRLDAGFTEQMFAAMLDEVATLEGALPPTLMGFSFGGSVAGHLAARAAQRGLTIGKVILIDGGCPVAWLTPKILQADRVAEQFSNQFSLCPLGEIPAQVHFLRALRGFPFAAPDVGARWTRVTSGALAEYHFDAQHAQIIRAPVSASVARCVDAILAGTAQPDALRPSMHDADWLEQINAAKGLAAQRRFDAAIARLETLEPVAQTRPDWLQVALIRLRRRAGRKDEVAQMAQAALTEQLPLAVLEILSRGSPRRRKLLERYHAQSGAAHGAALPLVELLFKTGATAAARSILCQLQNAPRLKVEAGLARGIERCLSGDSGAALTEFGAVLARPEACHSHHSWAAMFLARNGARAEALALLDQAQPRFPNAIQGTRRKLLQLTRPAAE